MPNQDPELFQSLPTDEQEQLAQLLRAQSGTDEDYQRQLRGVITKTPDLMAKEKLRELFGGSWRDSSKMQKTRRVLDIVSQLASPAYAPTNRAKAEAMQEYQATAPIAQREESAMSAVERARTAAQSAQAVAAQKDATTRLLGLERIRNQDDLNDIKRMIAEGNLALVPAKIEEMQARAGELNRRMPNLNEYNMSEWLGRLNPQQRQEFMERFGDIEAILGLKGAMRGGGAGSTTVSSQLPGGEYTTPREKLTIPGQTTSTRIPNTPFGGPQNVMQMMRGIAGGQQGQPQPQFGQPAGPQIRGNILPGPAAGQPAGPQAQALPTGAELPQQPYIDEQGVRHLPLDYTKGESETASRTATIQERRDVHSLAAILPNWAASGKLASFAGGPAGVLAELRAFGDMTPGAEAMFDRVFNKTQTREILPESGKAFSQREIDLIQQFVPRKMNSVGTLLNKAMALHYGLGTREFFETHNYTEDQINRIPNMAAYMERAITNIRDKSMKAQKAKSLGDANWQRWLPTQQELDPQFPIKLAIAAARAKVAGGKVKKEE